jgi:ribose-phosphate pyrophosphokinase
MLKKKVEAMINNSSGMVVCSGSSNVPLAREIAEYLKVELAKVHISKFSNGEIYIRFLESVRGAHVFVVQSISNPVNENIMELLIMIDALKRASAGVISAVIPHYGYARQDKKSAAREPITAKLMADLLTTAGANRVLAMDLHAGQIQGYFDYPVDHLTALPTLAAYFRERQIPDLVIVSPDVGRVKTAKKFADKLGADLAILHKERPEHNVAVVAKRPGREVIGEIEGKNVIIIDDMIDTAGTLVEGADALRRNGAKEVYAAATHPILSGPAIERLKKSSIKEVVMTNTISIEPGKYLDKFTMLSIAPLFAQAINNVYHNESVSEIFEGDNQL